MLPPDKPGGEKTFPPLVLRLIHVNDGGQEMYLVTTLNEE